MKEVSVTKKILTIEERNLLSVAYKNVVGARRASWRMLAACENQSKERGDTHKVEVTEEYRRRVEAELTEVCNDILTLLDNNLIPALAETGDADVEGGTVDASVFYRKMQVRKAKG
jgi:14-3-3 protein epsilon